MVWKGKIKITGFLLRLLSLKVGVIPIKRFDLVIWQKNLVKVT